MAAQIEDRTQHMQYLSTCLQQFLMECGRTQAILNNSVLQSDQEDFLIALLKMTAAAVGNIAVRQSPAYTSQAQGSVERFHRTLLEQVRALKLELENNYGIHFTGTHPTVPWMVKHAAYLFNRYAEHSDGNASYYRRWNKERKTPICELGETVLYMLNTNSKAQAQDGSAILSSHLARQRHLNKRRHPGHIPTDCQSKDSQETSKARQVQQTDDGHHQLHTYDNTNTDWLCRLTNKVHKHTEASNSHSRNTDTAATRTTDFSRKSTHANTGDYRCTYCNITNNAQQKSATTSSTKTRRGMEGSAAKQHRTEQQQTAAQRPETTQEPNRTRLRVSAVTVTTKRGDKVRAVSNEDQQEAAIEKILLEPWVTNTEGRVKGANNRRNETGDQVNESTTSLHGSLLQQAYCRPTHQTHQIKMGPSTEGQRSPSTDCGKRIHRRCQRQRRHLRINTHLLCIATLVDNVSDQELDSESRRHFNRFPTRQSSNK